MGFEIESKVPDAFKKSLVNATEHASKIQEQAPVTTPRETPKKQEAVTKKEEP